MQSIALALALILFSASARGHGPGTEFAIIYLLGVVLVLCVITVPIAMLLPNRPKGHRLGFGVCVPLAAVVAGVVGGEALPVNDDAGRLILFGVPVLAVVGLVWFVVAERSKVTTTK